jgi:hypothetical protein
MTVYDLDKKATPGPYSVCAPTDINNRGIDVAFTRCWIDDDAGRMEKTVIHAQIGSGSGDREATAALLAHCRNNYFKALKALNAVRDATMFDERACDRIQEPDRIPQGLRELIEELETVQ